MSGGGKPGTSSSGQPSGVGVGISTKKIGGGGPNNVQTTEQQQTQEKSQQARLREARINQQLEQQRQDESRRRAAETERQQREAERFTTKTGTYEKGGTIIQETTGKYENLISLKAQQPGSALVQKQSGEYVLIRSEGIDFGRDSNVEKINQNLGLEGKEGYHIVERKQKEGGTLYTPKLVDTSNISEDFGGSIIGPSSEGKGGTAYHIDINEGKRPKSETISFIPSARQQSEAISRGEVEPHFIGYQSGEARQQLDLSLKQQDNKGEEVFPITYTNEQGKEIVTITGKSEGANYNIYQPEKQIISLSNEKPSNSKSPVGFIESAKQSYENIGIDIASSLMTGGVPKYTKPVKEELSKYRKETQVDLLMQPEKWNQVNLQSEEFVGSAAAYASTILLGGGRTLPLKIERTSIPTEVKPGIPILGKPEGSETFFAGVRVGYGKYSKLIGATKASEAPLEKLTPPSSRGGFPISEETSGLLTSKSYLNELVSKGKITQEESQYIQDVKRGLQLTEGSKDIVKRTNLGKTPIASLRESETPRHFELIKEEQSGKNLPAAKGSIIQQYYSNEEYLRRSRDIDFQLKGSKQESNAGQTLGRFKTGLQEVAEPGRKFEVEGNALKVKHPQGEEKVMELLTKKEAGEQYPYTNPSQVFGLKVPFKEVKPNDIKTLTYRFQGLRKGSSATELTKEGVRPARGREKDVYDLVGYFETKASQFGGKREKELNEISLRIKGFAKKKGFWVEEGESSTIFEASPKSSISDYLYKGTKESKTLLSQPSYSSLSIKKKEEPTYSYSIGKSKSSYSSKSVSKSLYRQNNYPSSYTPQSKSISKQISYPSSKPITKTTSKSISYTFSKPLSKNLTPSSKPIYSQTSKISTRLGLTSISKITKSKPLEPRIYPLIPPVPPEKIPPVKPRKIPMPKTRKEKRQSTILAETKNFLGNVPQASIVGIYNRKEITYGDKKISNYLAYEKRGNKPKTRKAKKPKGFVLRL